MNILLIILIFCIAVSTANAESFDSLEKALLHPEKVTRLSIGEHDRKMKHLPPLIAKLTNLKELEISCMEDLRDLPEEIGSLSKLEKLIIDNGNGCKMNITIPSSIGNLKSLKVVRLYGAMDPFSLKRDHSSATSDVSLTKAKRLPKTVAKLENLEELDLGRNRLKIVPPEIASLHKLKILVLDYDDIHEIPSFIGELKNLQQLSIRSNGGVKLPASLATIKGLKINMGNNRLKLKDQNELRRLFPEAEFDFENEYDDSAANEEQQK
jgi:Leucine-rich repeat (LRR) protein